jgi:hypothetical protein
MNDQTIGSSSLEARIRRLENRESMGGFVSLYCTHVGKRDFDGPLWSEQESRIRHVHRELDRYVNGDK